MTASTAAVPPAGPPLAPSPTVVHMSSVACPPGADEARGWASDVWSAVDQLTDINRRVIRLIYIDGLSQLEAAESLGMSLAVVSQAAAAGLQEVFVLLGQTGAQSPIVGGENPR